MAMMFQEPRSSSIAPMRLMKPVTVNRPIMMPSVASSSVRYDVISACVSIGEPHIAEQRLVRERRVLHART